MTPAPAAKQAQLRSDPVLEVTGVPAAELLRRVQDVREGRGPDLVRPAARGPERIRHHRLVDFGDGTDEDFVEAVHLVLLGRRPTEPEVVRRLDSLRAGRSRFELVVRLALCQEGRRRADVLPVRGLGLPAIAVLARAYDIADRSQVLGGATRRAHPLVVRTVVGVRTTPPALRRLVRTGALLAGSAAVLARGRGLQTEVRRLRAQLADATGEGT